MARNLTTQLLKEIQRIAQHLEDIHPFGSDVVFRRDQPLTGPGNTFAQACDLFLHVATHCGVVSFPHHHVEVAPRRLVHVVDGGERGGTG